MTRTQAIERACNTLDSGVLAADLGRRIAYATESEEADRTASQLRAYLTQELVPCLARLGFGSQVIENPVDARLPLLIAKRVESATAPTLLMYAHGDVVRGHDAQWQEGLKPWVLHEQSEGTTPRWYGRGSADNKGQHSINFAALEQVIQARGGKLGFNVTWLIEMGEEAGSPGLREACALHRDMLEADLFIASDGPRVRADQPTLFLGSRGAFNFELHLAPRRGGHHSGNWGGLLANPAVELAHAVASMVDKRGRLLVQALRPSGIPPSVRRALQGLQIGGDAGNPSIDADWGEPGLSAAERVIGWNCLEVLAMTAGNPAQPVGAIPGRASVWCQLRFVVGTPFEAIAPALRRHLDEAGFAHVDLRLGMAGEASRLDPDDAWVAWAMQSIERTTQKKPALLPNLGGSLPNDIFMNLLGLPTLWVPHSYPGCNQHAANEHLLPSVAREGLAIMAGLFWDLGDTFANTVAARSASPNA